MNQKLKTYIKKEQKEKCYEEIKYPSIVFKDGLSAKFIISNQEQKTIYKVKVDGCLINTNGTKKCDWIACLENNTKTILIELKSKNLSRYKDACDQFLGTIKTVGLEKSDCFCILVFFKGFPKTGGERQKFSKSMNKKGLLFEHRKSEEEKSVSDLFFNNSK